MKNKIQINKTLFPILLPSEREKKQLLKANKAIDDCFEKKNSSSKKARLLRKNSIYRATVLQGPKFCNFRCPKYCYTEGIAKGILNNEQLKMFIRQATAMGAKVFYWPGLGELTLLNDFWGIQKYLHKRNIKSVVFTNGTVFWNDKLARQTTGMSSDELINLAKKLGIYFYVKFWNSNQKKAAEMVGVEPEEYSYANVKGRNIPLGLAKLMEKLPRGRVGIETMVSRENYWDVIENILPTISELDLYGYIEPVIFAGKAEGRQKELALTPEQYQSLMHLFASGGTYCKKRQFLELILVGDRLAPGIVIPPRKEDKVINANGRIRDIFEIFHNEYFRKMRKISEELNGCLCRAYWNGKLKV